MNNRENIQTAYNKGLDDAENALYENFTSWLNNQPTRSLPNPKLEDLRKRIIARFEELSKPTAVTQPETIITYDSYTVDENELLDAISSILQGKEYPPFEMDDSTKNILDIVKIRSDRYTSLGRGTSRIGKEFKKLVNEQTALLTSTNSMIN